MAHLNISGRQQSNRNERWLVHRLLRCECAINDPEDFPPTKDVYPEKKFPWLTLVDNKNC
jgi:hypothetical protein